MDQSTNDELSLLRARAYGRDADIDHDPEALARLHELEGQGMSLETVTDSRADVLAFEESATITDGVVSPDDPTGTENADFNEQDAVEPQNIHAVRDGSTSSALPRRRALWITSLLAGAAVAAALTYSLTSISPVSASHGSPQVANLAPTSAVTVPEGWLGATEDSVAFEFYGFVLFTTANWYVAPGDDATGAACIAVVERSAVPSAEEFNPNGYSFDGEHYSDCSFGSFPVTVEVPIVEATPFELRSRYPEGRAIQFVLEGDDVGVFLDSK
ncbi:hypothetical protein [Microbacterium sp. NPDC056234]|uniref:hypothetical protein n=1 Tax=Microbacterium sp. NPDC056234 TaxID=3345757 RepID=UPI0035DE53AD